MLVLVRLFLCHHSLVELKFASLQHISVTSSGLARSGRDLGKQTSGRKLGIQKRVQGALALSRLDSVLRNLALGREVNRRGFGGRLLQSNLHTIVGFIISFERMRINDNDSALDESLSTNQLVIGSVVGDIEDANLARGNLGSPRKVTRFELEGTEFLVSSSATNLMNAGLADLGHGRWTAQFKLALLAKLGTTASCLTALVATFTSNTLEEDNKSDREIQF